MRPPRPSYGGLESVGSEKKIPVGPLLAVVVCAFLASIIAVLVFPARDARGAVTLPPNFARSRVVGGLAKPTAMKFAPESRLFGHE